MTFVPDAALEARAAALWRRYNLEPGFDVEAFLDVLGLGLLWDELPADVLGAFKPATSTVILNDRRVSDFQDNPGWERFTVAHEIGHWSLHSQHSTSDGLPMLVGGRTWCRDGSRDAAEIQADRFAAFLLVPSDRLAPDLPHGAWEGWPPVYRLAERFRVTVTAMMVRLEGAGWAYRDAGGFPHSGRRPAPASGQASLPFD